MAKKKTDPKPAPTTEPSELVEIDDPPPKTDGRWMALLKIGEGCTCSLDIEIKPLGPGSMCNYRGTIKVQVNRSSSSFKTTHLETQEVTGMSRHDAEIGAMRRAIEMCVDYMGR